MTTSSPDMGDSIEVFDGANWLFADCHGHGHENSVYARVNGGEIRFYERKNWRTRRPTTCACGAYLAKPGFQKLNHSIAMCRNQP